MTTKNRRIIAVAIVVFCACAIAGVVASLLQGTLYSGMFMEVLPITIRYKTYTVCLPDGTGCQDGQTKDAATHDDYGNCQAMFIVAYAGLYVAWSVVGLLGLGMAFTILGACYPNNGCTRCAEPTFVIWGCVHAIILGAGIAGGANSSCGGSKSLFTSGNFAWGNAFYSANVAAGFALVAAILTCVQCCIPADPATIYIQSPTAMVPMNDMTYEAHQGYAPVPQQSYGKVVY